MNVALLIPVLSDKDAVGTDVLAMRSLLEGQGHRVRIYCESSQSKTEKTYPASDVLGFAGRPGDLIIYHFSVGWPRAIQLLARARSLQYVVTLAPQRLLQRRAVKRGGMAIRVQSHRCITHPTAPASGCP